METDPLIPRPKMANFSPKPYAMPQPGFPPQPDPSPHHQPSAPHLDQVIPGYEHVTYDPAFIQPPSPSAPGASVSHPAPSYSIAPLAEEQAKEALMQFVSENCCYGSKPARQMIISSMTMTSCFRYTLETFGEQRQTNWVQEPYQPGEYVDSAFNGVAPPPWDIPVGPPCGYFEEGALGTPVPHTTIVRPCGNCNGNGRNTCKNCLGRGRVQCWVCKGRGCSGPDRGCGHCSSTGMAGCTSCNSQGQIKCKTCQTLGNLKLYVKLSIKWQNHVEESISENSAVPHDLIKEATGTLAFEEQQPRVWPISNFPDAAVNAASRSLVDKHARSFPNERILQQRHKVQIVPVTEVRYQWKDRQGVFHVYGLQNRVYFPNYPSKCCCGCSII